MEEKKKLSYEELEQYAAQVSQQAQSLLARLQEVSLANVFKRLDYLFQVLNNAAFFDTKFVDNCVKEIKEIMTPEKETEKPDKEG